MNIRKFSLNVWPFDDEVCSKPLSFIYYQDGKLMGAIGFELPDPTGNDMHIVAVKVVDGVDEQLCVKTLFDTLRSYGFTIIVPKSIADIKVSNTAKYIKAYIETELGLKENDSIQELIESKNTKRLFRFFKFSGDKNKRDENNNKTDQLYYTIAKIVT